MERKLPTPVDDDELLARFILFKKHIRWSNRTVRPEALIPAPKTQLSVTRHRGFTDEQIWEAGCGVARIRRAQVPGASLHGRIDILAVDARSLSLRVNPDEPPINHANIEPWPADEAAQLNIAQKLAAKNDVFIPKPDEIDCSSAQGSPGSPQSNSSESR